MKTLSEKRPLKKPETSFLKPVVSPLPSRDPRFQAIGQATHKKNQQAMQGVRIGLEPFKSRPREAGLHFYTIAAETKCHRQTHSDISFPRDAPRSRDALVR